MQKRGTDEDTARSFIEDILSCIPAQSNAAICGDWNAPIGELTPQIGENVTTRKSLDTTTNARAPWIINICE